MKAQGSGESDVARRCKLCSAIFQELLQFFSSLVAAFRPKSTPAVCSSMRTPGQRKKVPTLLLLSLSSTCLANPIAPCLNPTRTGSPNVVLILADDLGYGDLGCQNPGSKIRTPRLDRLASQGMRFTDAHAASAVCTPSRYSLLTGQYCLRTRLKSGVLNKWDEPLIA